MLQLFVVFYVPPLMTNGGFNFSRINAALIAFIINYSAYFSEIYLLAVLSLCQRDSMRQDRCLV